MHVFTHPSELKQHLEEKRKKGLKTGFVPTMGALHKGHEQLLKTSKNEGCYTVCSIFVNPLQFNQKEDFEKYPRNLQRDLEILSNSYCDVAFIPRMEDIYPDGIECNKVDLEPGYLIQILEGTFRPGHFRGVLEVVYRLFDIIKPHTAYFGLKDYQQCKVVEWLRNHYFPDIALRFLPTVREQDGLAISSRNQRLSARARKKATALFHALRESASLLREGYSPDSITRTITKKYFSDNDWKLEYLEFRRRTDLMPFQESDGLHNGVILVAAWLEGVRLIDNIEVE